ncbi:MAG: UdgX family uracil-DNA binding protein [Pseudomonadota bacterium]
MTGQPPPAKGPRRESEPYRVRLAHPSDMDTWRDSVRRLVCASVPSKDVMWAVGEAERGLFGIGRSIDGLPQPAPEDWPRAPRRFADLAALVICHKSPTRFALLHRLLERFADEPQLLRVASDPDVAEAERMAKNVRRCSHKMKAFVRFRSTKDADGVERFVAWFEPEHHTLDLTSGFFVRRFANMRWSILTPLRSAHWDGKTLQMGEGATRDIAPDGDVNEDLWRTYFGAIFNPARLKINAMTSEMPKRYWKNMPEAELIQPLIRKATARSGEMLAAEPRAPARSTRQSRARALEEARAAAATSAITTLDDLRTAAHACTRCPLHADATQVVLGEGPPDAPLMFVGEQPGDKEDIAGRPFVGPAGTLFDQALKDAGIDRDAVYLTNAVKHFKFEPRGKRRIHKRPSSEEITHCRYWLDLERALVKPSLTVALGASAIRALSGKALSVSRVRGQECRWADGGRGIATIHPSAILRIQNPSEAKTAYTQFVNELAFALKLL